MGLGETVQDGGGMNLEFVNTMIRVLAWPIGFVMICFIIRKILMDIM